MRNNDAVTAAEPEALAAALRRDGLADVAEPELECHGIGSFPAELTASAIRDLFAAAADKKLTLDYVEHPLSEVESAWNRPERLVFVP